MNATGGRMPTSIPELKSQFMTLHDNAIRYFQDELHLMEEKLREILMKEPSPGFLTTERFKFENQLDEADQREIAAYTKTMRAALYFRQYF
jgi:hypothetical protein